LSKNKKNKTDKFRKTWSYVVPYFYRYKKTVFLVVILSGLASVADPVLALLAKPVTNMALQQPDILLGRLWMVSVGIVVLMTYRSLFTFLSKYIMARVIIKVMRNIRVALYHHFMFLSLDHYERTTTGEMMARTINDVAQMHRVVPLTIEVFQYSFQLILLAGVCLYQQPYLSLLAMIAIPLTVYPTQRIGSSMKRYTKKGLRQVAQLHQIIQETYSGAKVVKAFAKENDEISRYARENDRLLRIQYKHQAVKQLISPLIGVIASFGVALVAYFGMRKMLLESASNEDVIGEFISYLMAIALMYNPVKKLGSIFGDFNNAYGAAERIQETFEKQSTVTESENAAELPLMKEEIRYENVSFSYDKELVLKDFNLVARSGELVALVGESGAGKTTVVNLLPRFYDVTEGRITIDGVDIKDVTFESLRKQIGVVTQETFLFYDTVANNILYGSEGKSMDEVVAAAKAANAHQFIAELPQGYDSIVGERGVRLSGGQRQRLAIARALLKDPPILILDEATSALDTSAEREVQAALDAIMKNRTTIAIAHRLSTIRHADKIVVISRGSVIEQGTHNQLMELGGEYKRLYEMQFFLGDYATDHYGKKERAAEH